MKALSANSRCLARPSLCVLALLASPVAFADCTDDIQELDNSYQSAGYMIGDGSATTTSGYLQQSRSLRDSALILLSNDREDECIKLIAQARKLANKASKPSVFSVEELVGREVVDPSGQGVGEVENVMVDLDRGIVAYALISFGGFLGIGEDLVPVPFGKLSQSLGSDALEIATSFERVENAPRYIEGDWDLMSRRSWATDVYNYYGEDLYWAERRGGASQASVSGGGMAAAQENAQSDDSASGTTQADAGKSGQSTHEPLRGFGHLFRVLDSDRSGDLSLDESRREFAVFKNFLELDGDGSGSLSEDEYMTLTNSTRISSDGETIIPNAKDAMPEEKWTGGKEETEATSDEGEKQPAPDSTDGSTSS